MSAPENTQPPDPRGLHGATTQAVGALERAVDVLKIQHDAVEKSNVELRADVKDMRDRVLKLELKVDALPTKEWIAKEVAGTIKMTATIVSLVGGLIAIVTGVIHGWH